MILAVARRSGPGERGMTVLELLIVIAIIGGFAYIAASGLRTVTKADLVDDALRMGAIMKRASQLAMESGQVHRLALDLDTRRFVVEVCEGSLSVQRGEPEPVSERARADLLAQARERLAQQAGAGATIAPPSPEADLARATALAGRQLGNSVCQPVEGAISGDAEGRGLAGELHTDKGIKFRELWVQHREDSITAGTAAIHFFPIGSAEKAIVSLTDGSETFSVLVHGLTGRIEMVDGEIAHPDEHMMRDAEGNKEADR